MTMLDATAGQSEIEHEQCLSSMTDTFAAEPALFLCDVMAALHNQMINNISHVAYAGCVCAVYTAFG
jgi:hypothetical protein